MAKPKGIFDFSGTFQGVTTVHSKTYGEHLRKARKTFSLGIEMKNSSAQLSRVNAFAKVFKDAIDPYRIDFRDGMLWQRLISLFKIQLNKNGALDFKVLEEQDLNKIHRFGSVLSSKTTAEQSKNTLTIHVQSRHTKNPTNGRADGYQQTLIVIFVDKNLKTESVSESVFISLEADPGEQYMQCIIPASASTAIIVLKCNFSSSNKPMGLQKAMGMRVEKVVDLVCS